MNTQGFVWKFFYAPYINVHLEVCFLCTIYKCSCGSFLCTVYKCSCGSFLCTVYKRSCGSFYAPYINVYVKVLYAPYINVHVEVFYAPYINVHVEVFLCTIYKCSIIHHALPVELPPHLSNSSTSNVTAVLLLLFTAAKEQET